MTNKRLPNPAESLPADVDDIKRIRGIGPGIAQRLYAAGILTFDQLAERSPAELAAIVSDVAGMSADQIVKKDWVGQARELAMARAPETLPQELPAPETFAPGDATATPASRQHYATFTVELLLDEENAVRRTRVTHIQVGAEEAWSGWRPTRLVDFFVRHAAVREPADELASAEVEAAPAPAEAAAPTMAAHLRALDLVPADAAGPRSFLRHRQLFAAGLTIELDGAAHGGSAPLAYSAAVYAKDLQRLARSMLGEAHGTLAAPGPVTLRIEGAELPRGIYRLDATVVVVLPADESGQRQELSAFREGGLLQVY
jgi:hypothetical protein